MGVAATLPELSEWTLHLFLWKNRIVANRWRKSFSAKFALLVTVKMNVFFKQLFNLSEGN